MKKTDSDKAIYWRNPTTRSFERLPDVVVQVTNGIPLRIRNEKLHPLFRKIDRRAGHGMMFLSTKWER